MPGERQTERVRFATACKVLITAWAKQVVDASFRSKLESLGPVGRPLELQTIDRAKGKNGVYLVGCFWLRISRRTLQHSPRLQFKLYMGGDIRAEMFARRINATLTPTEQQFWKEVDHQSETLGFVCEPTEAGEGQGVTYARRISSAEETRIRVVDEASIVLLHGATPLGALLLDEWIKIAPVFWKVVASLEAATAQALSPRMLQAAHPVLLPNPSSASAGILRDVIASHLLATTGSSDRNLILEGVPGTGKTFLLESLRKVVGASPSAPSLGEGRFAMTMHPATAYEDFVEGLRPGAFEEPSAFLERTLGVHEEGNLSVVRTTSGSAATPVPGDWFCNDRTSVPDTAAGSAFSVQNGFFVSACIEAAHYPECTFVVLLDELNRCNVPKVMGDLLTTIESSKRAKWRRTSAEGASLEGAWDISAAQVVTLPFSKRQFFVPDNIFVVGTMNTTDRSVAPLDSALRRRFVFRRCWPTGFDPANPRKVADDLIDAVKGLEADALESLKLAADAWKTLNEKLQDFGDDAMLGHSYLFDLARDLAAAPHADRADLVAHHWNTHLFPQLIDVLLSNDLLDEAFKDAGPGDSGVSLPALGLGAKDTTARIEASGATLELRWTLRGKGMLRIPTIRFVKAS